MLKTFSLISDIRRLSTQTEIAVLLPHVPITLSFIFSYLVEKRVNYGFFLKLTSNSVMFRSYCNLSHMDGHLCHCFCVILIDCIGFLMRLPTFG